MSRNEIVIDVPPADVYALLLDAEAYPRWLVGAKDIRGTDPGWPRKGKRFHHRVGVGPVTVEDNTKLVEKRPNERVALEVRFRPGGVGIVQFELAAADDGRATKVTMTEDFTQGPAARIPGVLQRPLLLVRNALSLRRLRSLLASRSERR